MNGVNPSKGFESINASLSGKGPDQEGQRHSCFQEEDQFKSANVAKAEQVQFQPMMLLLWPRQPPSLVHRQSLAPWIPKESTLCWSLALEKAKNCGT